ncbi:MAG: SRPBCC domain-containing protein [Bacteroidota bacterium]
MKEIQTEVTINSSADKVYAVLTDFSAYHEWNPFIISSKGKAEAGSILTNTMLSKGKEQVFRPEILVAEAGKRLEWLGKMPLNLFNGQHYFEIVPIGENQVILRHGEHFSGLARPLIMAMIGEDTRRGFEAMNQALKARCEESVLQ